MPNFRNDTASKSESSSIVHPSSLVHQTTSSKHFTSISNVSNEHSIILSRLNSTLNKALYLKGNLARKRLLVNVKPSDGSHDTFKKTMLLQ